MTTRKSCIKIEEKLVNGEIMKELLAKANITQVELAKRLNVTQSLISQWVRGICEPKIKQVTLIAKILGVTIEKVVECFTK